MTISLAITACEMGVTSLDVLAYFLLLQFMYFFFGDKKNQTFIFSRFLLESLTRFLNLKNPNSKLY